MRKLKTRPPKKRAVYQDSKTCPGTLYTWFFSASEFTYTAIVVDKYPIITKGWVIPKEKFEKVCREILNDIAATKLGSRLFWNDCLGKNGENSSSKNMDHTKSNFCLLSVWIEGLCSYVIELLINILNSNLKEKNQLQKVIAFTVNKYWQLL